MYAYLHVGLLSLGLADNCVGDEGASSLADLLRQTGYLQRLLLSGNEVADEGGSKLVAALTQNTSLKALYLARVCPYLLLYYSPLFLARVCPFSFAVTIPFLPLLTYISSLPTPVLPVLILCPSLCIKV